MNVSTEQNIFETESSKADTPRHARTSIWVRPQIQRLAAGSAEDGFNNNPDGFQPS
jgi:hypothetical protein